MPEHSPDEERVETPTEFLLSFAARLREAQGNEEATNRLGPEFYERLMALIQREAAALAAAEREEQSLATERDEWRERAQKAERRLAETQDRVKAIASPQREGEDG